MDHASRVDVALADLLKHEGLTGASLISRDGLCVRAAGRSEVSRETFSAMSATLMGAAEIALRELDNAPARSIVAATPSACIIIVGASREMLLVASARADVPLAPLVARVEEAARGLAKILSGA
ncbi:MAG: Roadblock/LC7 domain [Thermoplasmata archaeon]|jgi:predicted regulator of Ras-like GTPase activity (Roadblock/LC7/MglB family)|nr:Roadblock/LC7 domain [Thermoplasmata archaeon]